MSEATRRFGAVAFATVAGAAGFALYTRVDWPWFVLGWCALAPWLGALDRLATLRAAALAGLAMSIAFTLAVFAWFGSAIQHYANLPVGVAFGVLVAIAPLIQPQFITTAIARCFARRRGAGWGHTALISASIYVGTEWTGPKLFGDTIGHGFLVSPLLRQAADVAGAAGLTFVLILANDCMLAIARAALDRAPRRAARPALVLGGMLAVLLVYGSVRLREFTAPPNVRIVRAGIVQADISGYERLAAGMGTYDAVRYILDSYFDLSSRLLERGRVDFLLWPETVYPTTFGSPKSDAGATFDAEIAAFATRAAVPIVFGSYDTEDGKEFNAAVFLRPSPDGRLAFDAYRKALLFPFTEYVPALLDTPAIRSWFPWLGTWTPGPGARAVPLPIADGHTVLTAPLICYEAVDAGHAIAAVRGGAELIVTMSNDSWFAAGGGPKLHLVVSAFRSIETRRPQLRVTNTGISAVIDATGEVEQVLGVHERGAMIGSAAPATGAWTLILACGDWFGGSAFVASIALLVAAVARPRRTRPPG